MKILESIITVNDKNLENKLIDLLHQFDTVKITDVIKNKIELIEKMSITKPDILFIYLDTNEWDINDLINQFQRPPFIIGITSKVYNALSLLENGLFDILTPKLDGEKFYKKIVKILRIVRHFTIDNQGVAESKSHYRGSRNVGIPSKEYIFVKYKKANTKLNFDDILCVNNTGNSLRIELTNGKICYHTSTLKKFYSLLPNDKFLRINKSTVINVEKIDNLTKGEVFIKKHRFKVSRIYSKALKDTLLHGR